MGLTVVTDKKIINEIVGKRKPLGDNKGDYEHEALEILNCKGANVPLEYAMYPDEEADILIEPSVGSVIAYFLDCTTYMLQVVAVEAKDNPELYELSRKKYESLRKQTKRMK